MMPGKIFVYVGNWTVQSQDAEGGIGIYEYNEKDGSLRYIDSVRKDLTAGMMCVDRRRGVLYSTDEQQNSPTFGMLGGGGRVAAFSINPETGALTELGDEQPSFGTLTSYVAQDGTGDWLVAVNHGDKQAITKTFRDADGVYRTTTDFSDVNASLYPISSDGSIQPACDLLNFKPDCSRFPIRTACLHSVCFAPDGEHCIVTDMKQNRIYMLRVDRKDKKLKICDCLDCPEGNWPRYGVFHPIKRLFYLNNEHALIVSVIRYDDNWKMEILQTLDSTPQLPIGRTGKRPMQQTDIRISVDGKYIYNLYWHGGVVTAFSIDGKSGLLSMIQSLKLDCNAPRGSGVSPDGRFLLVADPEAGTISTLVIGKDGRLALTGIADHNMQHPAPVCFYRSGL